MPNDAITDSEAHLRAGDRLLSANGSIYAAFDSLNCGFNHEQALAFMLETPVWQTIPVALQGITAGMILGFAMVAIESDRILADEEGNNGKRT
jgi:hypothetical protein